MTRKKEPATPAGTDNTPSGADAAQRLIETWPNPLSPPAGTPIALWPSSMPGGKEGTLRRIRVLNNQPLTLRGDDCWWDLGIIDWLIRPVWNLPGDVEPYTTWELGLIVQADRAWWTGSAEAFATWGAILDCVGPGPWLPPLRIQVHQRWCGHQRRRREHRILLQELPEGGDPCPAA